MTVKPVVSQPAIGRKIVRKDRPIASFKRAQLLIDGGDYRVKRGRIDVGNGRALRNIRQGAEAKKGDLRAANQDIGKSDKTLSVANLLVLKVIIRL